MSLWTFFFGSHHHHSNHSNYSDSSMRDEIARLEQEAQDMERKFLRVKESGAEEANQCCASLSDTVDKIESFPQEFVDCFDSEDDTFQQWERAVEVLKGLVSKDQERLKAIDQTIARINQIELESGDEGKQQEG